MGTEQCINMSRERRWNKLATRTGEASLATVGVFAAHAALKPFVDIAEPGSGLYERVEKLRGDLSMLYADLMLEADEMVAEVDALLEDWEE